MKFMFRDTLIALCVVALVCARVGLAAEQADGPDAQPDGGKTLVGVIVSVEGRAEVRLSDDQPWQAAAVGQEVSPGASFRTGLRSGIVFEIPPKQTIAIDRLGVVTLARAVERAGGSLSTALAMPYGRTRFHVQADVDHETQVVTPSAAMSVRGSDGGMQDGAFGYDVWSNEDTFTISDFGRRDRYTLGPGASADSARRPGEKARDRATHRDADDRTQTRGEREADARRGDAQGRPGGPGSSARHARNLRGNDRLFDERNGIDHDQ